jgi:DMSO reductase family type II enzyme heme b subunit
MRMNGYSQIKKTAAILAFFITLALSAAPAVATTVAKEVYDKRCAWCHGEKGAGNGPAAEFLNPSPRDFTSGVYKWKSTPFDEIAPSDDDLAGMIKGGRTHNAITGWTGMSGTSMPGWADTLDDREVAGLAAFIKKFAELEAPAKGPVDLSKQIKSSRESIERGRKVFKDRCSECHGEEGRGDGTKKLKDDWGGRTWPRDLTKGWSFRVSNDPKDIYTRVTVGIPGTQMPSFADPSSTKKLTQDERWDVANYAASLNTPYKKPGDTPVINALRVDGSLPEAHDDPAWQGAGFRSFYLLPQIIAGERHFKPSLDSISAKALYNDSEIAILIEWDDRTKSLPGDAKAIEIADGEVFEDAVAVQWPVTIPRESERPYFGHGDASWPVNIWYWRSEGGAQAPQTVRLLNAKGIKEVEDRDPVVSGLKAVGVYDRGTWRVVMKRPLKTNDPAKDIQLEEGRFIPVAFAAWDGSNGEKGSRHELTTWVWVLMQPEATSEVYIWPVAVGLLIFGVEILLLKSARRRE